MIDFLPPIYPDELVYSWIARWYARSGYSAYSDVIGLFYEKRTIRPDVEFINRLNGEALTAVLEVTSIEELILEHTMFPHYGRFLPPERLRRAWDAMRRMDGNPHNLLAIPTRKNGTRYLRYCPCCVAEDREKYGETYWHRSHQLVGVDVCPYHGSYLLDTSVIIAGKASPRLYVADMECPDAEPSYCPDALEKRVARYVHTVMQQPVMFDLQTSIGRFLHSKLEWSPYVSARGEQRNMRQLISDLYDYYGDSAPDDWKIHKILNGYYFQPVEICQLALFLKISPEDLCRMELPEKSQPEIIDEKIKELHAQGLKSPAIARQLGMSTDAVKRIAGNYKISTYSRAKGGKAGRRAEDWERMDAELLPEVEAAIDELHGDGTERPRRVNITSVQKLLALPDKTLDRLPDCRELVLRHQESQAEYWARKVVWAYNSLLSQGDELTYTHLRSLTNMRRSDFASCSRHLGKYTDADTAEAIRGIIC